MVHTSPNETAVYPHKLRRLYWPFLGLAEACREIVGTVAGTFTDRGRRYTIPRFVYHGAAGERPPVRVGLFALLEGDLVAGALAFERTLAFLVRAPFFAAGLELALYPLCNPTGYEDGTRANRAGVTLAHQFWCGSAQPELRILEQELAREQFDALVVVGAEPGFVAPATQFPRPYGFRVEPQDGMALEEQVASVEKALRELVAEFREFVVPAVS